MSAGIPLADATACPDCASPFRAGADRCAACGLPLRGPLAVELWHATVRLNELAAYRAQLLAQLRAYAAHTTYTTHAPPPLPGSPPAPMPPASPPYAPAPAAPPARAQHPPQFVAWGMPAPTAPPRPRREWTAKRVQNLLLTLAVLLLVVAAVIFSAVNWGSLTVATRAAILTGVTVATGVGARAMHRRDLVATAEALGALMLALLLLDAYGARKLGLAGLDAPRGSMFWAGAVAVVSAVAGAYARVVPLAVLRWSAAAGVQLPMPIALVDANISDAAKSVLLSAQVAAVTAATKAVLAKAKDVARVALVGAGLTALVALPLAFNEAFGDDAVAGSLALVVLAGVAALVAWLFQDDQNVRDGGAGTATALLLVAAAAIGRQELTADQLPAVLAASALIAVVGSAALPRRWRRAPMWVGAAGVGVPVLLVAVDALTGLLGPYAWLARPWTVASTESARAALTPDSPWGGTVVVLVVLLVAAATAVLLAELGGRRDVVLLPVTLTVALAVVLVPLGQAWSYHVAVGWDVVAGAALTAVAGPMRRSRGLTANALYGGGLVVLGTALAWSLADERTTVVAFAAAAVLLAVVAFVDRATAQVSAGLATALACAWTLAAALSSGAPLERAAFLLAVVGAVCAAAGRVARGVGNVVAGVGVAAYGVGAVLAIADPGWLSWSLAAGVLAGLAVAAVDAALRVVAAAATAALACTWAYVFAVSRGAPHDRAGFVAALAGCLVVGAGALLSSRERAVGDAVEAVGAAAYAVALVPAATGTGWLSWTLAVGGLTALADALRPERRDVAWAGGVLLSGWSWVRLWLEDVRAPEAYAAPVAVTALVLGHLRRRADERVSSWAAYGPGLAALLLPSLFVALTDPGLTRPLLLGLGSLGVVLWGASERLQAPLVLGGAALAVDAVVQIVPYVGELPRWVPIAAAGLLLLAVGVTFEQRRRDLDRLRDRFESMT